MRKFTTQLVIILTLSAIGCVSAQERFPLTGIWSNLEYNAEGGDLLGMELLILPASRGSGLRFVVLVQIAEGGAPYSALVPLMENLGEIEFALPNTGPYAGVRFVGRLDGTELVVDWPGGQQEHLKRGKSYWEY